MLRCELFDIGELHFFVAMLEFEIREGQASFQLLSSQQIKWYSMDVKPYISSFACLGGGTARPRMHMNIGLSRTRCQATG